MTTRQYSSRSQQTTLTSAITSGSSTMTVISATGVLGGVTIPTGRTFTMVIDPDTALEEIVDATYLLTNTFTITRGVDGSSPQDHSAGAVVRHMAIGRDYRDANLHAEASAYYNDGSGTGHTLHGISSGEGEVVGTLKVQTLTNKTLTSPTITNPNITGAGVDASIVFEGTTSDAYETTLTVVDPTQDNTVTIPNTSGTIVLTTAAQTLTNKTLTSPTISGSPVITGLSSAGMVASSATPKDYVDSILGSATAAATSAASAATSASSAATSASSASTSAFNALTSANSAATSATAAATSASSAATSASAASTSATNAATSEANASASATAAATSATSAAASATAASTSATSAAASATAAATSATSAAASAVDAATSASSAAASFDSFDDRYLGPKSSAPTTDNDGNPLTNGVLYYNTVSGVMFVYNGNTSAWEQVAVSTSGFATLAAANTFTNSPQQINIASTTATGLIVRAAASQTADLQQWQNSAAASLANINANGAFGSQYVQVQNTVGAAVASGESQFRVISPNSSTDIRFWNRNDAGGMYYYNSAGGSANVLRITHSTTPRLVTQLVQDFTSGTSAAYGARVNIDASAAATIGLAVRGAASQTANLQEWQDSAGTVLSRISASGHLIASSRSVFGGATAIVSGVILGAISQEAAAIPIVARGAASQTANLQEWQNSAGSVLGYINAGGDFWVTGASRSIFVTNRNNTGSYIDLSTNVVGVHSRLAATVGLVVKGAASQTANLQEWQDSSGNILARIGSSGQLVINTSATGASSVIGIASAVAGSTLTVGIAFATSTGLVIRSAASQTANLQEWQNSGGTVLSYIDSAGNVNFSSTGSFAQASTGRAFFRVNSSTTVPMTLRAAASQTANLQEWQDSSGATLSSINAGGSLELNKKDVELMTIMGAY